MIDDPKQATVAAQQVAFTHLLIPVHTMATEFPAALARVSAALEQQGIAPTGPLFAHHFRRPTDTFDFNVCLPVDRAIIPNGDVQPLLMPPMNALHTTYHGHYSGLPHAWGDFITAVQSTPVSAPLSMRGDFIETYVVGPHDNPDPTAWRTDLSIILADTAGAPS